MQHTQSFFGLVKWGQKMIQLKYYEEEEENKEKEEHLKHFNF